MNKLLFVMWLIAGVLVLIGGEVSPLLYGLCWLNLLIKYLEDIGREDFE